MKRLIRRIVKFFNRLWKKIMSMFNFEPPPFREMKQVKLSTTGAGTWTHPTDLNLDQKLLVTLVAGGGGGGVDTSTDEGGGGGGGGEVVYRIPITVTGSSTPYYVGAGGAGRSGSTGHGTNGQDTYFGPTDNRILAHGGKAGEDDWGGNGGGSTATATLQPGAGGYSSITATGEAQDGPEEGFKLMGGGGGYGCKVPAVPVYGGDGGDSLSSGGTGDYKGGGGGGGSYGKGGNGGEGSGAPTAGVDGGGGGGDDATAAAGGDGFILIEYVVKETT